MSCLAGAEEVAETGSFMVITITRVSWIESHGLRIFPQRLAHADRILQWFHVAYLYFIGCVEIKRKKWDRVLATGEYLRHSPHLKSGL